MRGIPSLAEAQRAYAAYQQYNELDKQYGITDKAVAAKQAADDLERRLTSAVSGATSAAASAATSAASSFGAAFSSAPALVSAAPPPADRTWKVHCVEKLEGGGRGRMEDAELVQPAGQFVLFLRVRGCAVERTALPMGKDEVVPGEMLTVGIWMVRVVHEVVHAGGAIPKEVQVPAPQVPTSAPPAPPPPPPAPPPPPPAPPPSAPPPPPPPAPPPPPPADDTSNGSSSWFSGWFGPLDATPAPQSAIPSSDATSRLHPASPFALEGEDRSPRRGSIADAAFAPAPAMPSATYEGAADEARRRREREEKRAARRERERERLGAGSEDGRPSPNDPGAGNASRNPISARNPTSANRTSRNPPPSASGSHAAAAIAAAAAGAPPPPPPASAHKAKWTDAGGWPGRAAGAPPPGSSAATSSASARGRGAAEEDTRTRGGSSSAAIASLNAAARAEAIARAERAEMEELRRRIAVLEAAGVSPRDPATSPGPEPNPTSASTLAKLPTSTPTVIPAPPKMPAPSHVSPPVPVHARAPSVAVPAGYLARPARVPQSAPGSRGAPVGPPVQPRENPDTNAFGARNAGASPVTGSVRARAAMFAGGGAPAQPGAAGRPGCSPPSAPPPRPAPRESAPGFAAASEGGGNDKAGFRVPGVSVRDRAAKIASELGGKDPRGGSWG